MKQNRGTSNPCEDVGENFVEGLLEELADLNAEPLRFKEGAWMFRVDGQHPRDVALAQNEGYQPSIFDGVHHGEPIVKDLSKDYLAICVGHGSIIGCWVWISVKSPRVFSHQMDPSQGWRPGFQA